MTIRLTKSHQTPRPRPFRVNRLLDVRGFNIGIGPWRLHVFREVQL